MNRKRKGDQIRKQLMRMGKNYYEEYLNTDDDGNRYPNRREWGYGVFITVNGRRICAVGRNRYEAMKGALDAAIWASQEPYFTEPKGSKVIVLSDEEASKIVDETVKKNETGLT